MLRVQNEYKMLAQRWKHFKFIQPNLCSHVSSFLTLIFVSSSSRSNICETLYTYKGVIILHILICMKNDSTLYRSRVTSFNCQNMYQLQSNQSHFRSATFCYILKLSEFRLIIETYFRRCGAQYTCCMKFVERKI